MKKVNPFAPTFGTEYNPKSSNIPIRLEIATKLLAAMLTSHKAGGHFPIETRTAESLELADELISAHNKDVELEQESD